MLLVRLNIVTEQWYFNIKTGEVECGKQTHGADRLGPYPDEATAKRALEIVQERNKIADENDEQYR